MPTGYGVQFERSNDSGTTYSKIAKLKSTELSATTRQALEIQATDLDVGDADYGYKTFEGGVLKDPGEITLTLIDDGDASHATLVADMDAAEAGYYRTVMPQLSKQYTFRGVVTEVSDPTTGEDEQVMFTVKIKRSGQVVESAA